MFYGCFGWHMALCEIGWWILSNVWVWCFVFFKYLVPSRLGHNLKGQRIELDDIKKDIFSVFMIRIVRRLPCSGKNEEWLVERSPLIVSSVMLSAWLSGSWLVEIFIQIRLNLYLVPCWGSILGWFWWLSYDDDYTDDDVTVLPYTWRA